MLRLRTLGGLALSHDEEPLAGAALQPRRLAVLAVLAAAGDRGVSRDRLLALLWPERDSASGRQALSQALYALRRDTGVEQLVLGGGTEQLRLNPDAVSADVVDFEAALARGARDAAATHYAGPFLDGIHLSGDDGTFERWVDDQRVHLASRAERTLETLAAEAQAAGDHAAAAEWWRRLTMLDPLRTRAAAGLIQALAASGDRGGALRHAEFYSRRVREDLGAAPSAVVVSLAERLRADVGDADASELVGGRYAVERELGRGGMAVVLLARDVKHDRLVALKMLRPELNAAVDRERMLREIRVTARLQHPHVLPLHDSGEHAGQLFYVMPYVAGETLRTRLQRDGALPVSTALRLAGQMADALAHAHRHGIVHRDVKPENVLLSGEDDAELHAIVADFGIVHLVAGAAADRLTMPHFALGTPAYMSPEQIVGDADIDARSDVFALGCVLFEMLAGRPPWIGTAAGAVLARRFTEAAPSLLALRPEVPSSVDDAVHRALALDPEARFPSAAAFGRELAAAEALTGGTAATLPATSSVPAPPTELVGRARERSAALALLVRPEVRLLTLTGAGGSGKTTLALQLAADAAAVFEAAAFVDLAPLDEAALVPVAIAAALGVRDREDRSLLDAIAATIGTRRMLLLLDNLEQVAGTAPDLARLLAAAPRLTVLATSRVRLRVRGEHEFFVAPLELPDLSPRASVEALTAASAVELFVRRARAARPDLVLDEAALRAAAELCVRLDGLPLAIELAAARTRLLSPRAILARIAERGLDFLADGAADLPARQRTLRAAIAWSHDLLGARERAALRALGVFAGTFSLDAMRAVLDVAEDEALTLAQALSDASLARRAGEDEDGPRLALLETIRAFALERLRDADEETATRDRHLAHYLALAERLAPALTGAQQGEAVSRFERDLANLRSALEWSAARAEEGQPASLVRLTRAVWRVWLVSGQWTQGRGWLRRAAAHAAPDDPARAELLAAAGSMAQNQGDYEDAYDCVHGALAAWRALGDRAGEARALASLGWLAAVRRSQFAEGRRLSRDSLAIHRELGDERGAAQALSNIGWVAMFEGAYREATALLAESLQIRRRLGDRREVAFTLTTLAWATGRGGDTASAEARLAEALDLFQAIGERQLFAFAASIGAELALLGGRVAEAAEAVALASIPTFREIGDRWGIYFALGLLGDAHLAEGRLAEARREYEESEAIVRALGDAYGAATSAARFALLAAAEGHAEVAESGADEAERAMQAIGGAIQPWLAARLPRSRRVTAPMG